MNSEACHPLGHHCPLHHPSLVGYSSETTLSFCISKRPFQPSHGSPHHPGGVSHVCHCFAIEDKNKPIVSRSRQLILLPLSPRGILFRRSIWGFLPEARVMALINYQVEYWLGSLRSSAIEECFFRPISRALKQFPNGQSLT